MNESVSVPRPMRREIVWDPLVRIGHWALVAAFAIAYVTAEEDTAAPDVFHVWGGYVIGAIVVLRILWGFVGPQHARFSDFVCSPVAALRYLAGLISGGAKRHLGHSPAGGAMVIALLACLGATVVTGIMANETPGKAPPAQDAAAVVRPALADAERGGDRGERSGETESAIGELHAALANITLGLVILHILGVGLASFAHRENLVAAMIDGTKRAED